MCDFASPEKEEVVAKFSSAARSTFHCEVEKQRVTKVPAELQLLYLCENFREGSSSCESLNSDNI